MCGDSIRMWKMVKEEELPVLNERMETMDPDENEIYKFLGIEQADGIKTKVVFERVKREVGKRVKMLVNTELNDSNLISAINVKVIPFAAYAMNVCKFSKGELNELDQIVKRELRSKQMFGKQASDERLYLKREDGGRGLKSMRDLDVYKETRLRVACYMSKSENWWIQAAWRRETLKEENAVVTEARTTIKEAGITLEFKDNMIQLNGEKIDQEWKPTWRRVKSALQKGARQKRIETY